MDAGERGFEVVFGTANHATVSLGDICVFRQVRGRIEPESLQELKGSLVIEHEGDDGFETDLINVISVAILEEPHALVYLEELNLARGTHYTLEGLPRRDDDTYVFLINGHRRRQSMEEIGKEHGISPDRIGVIAKAYRNVSYSEAVRRQLNENIYARPKPYEEARLVVDIFNLHRNRHPRYTAADCARDLGITGDRVRDAMAYIGLPDIVKEAVVRGPKHGGISFTLGVELARVQQAYIERYTAMEADGTFEPYERYKTPQDLADFQTGAFLQLVYNRMSGNASTNTGLVRAFIAGRVAAVRGEPSVFYDQGELELGVDIVSGAGSAAEVARARSRGRAVTRIALGGVRVGLQVDPALLQNLGLPPADLLAIAEACRAAAGLPPASEDKLF